MKSRLLHVVPRWDFPSAEHQLLELAAGLDRDRYQLSVLLLGEQIDLAKRLAQFDIEIHHDSDRPKLHLADMRRIRRNIRQTFPDLIHLWDAARNSCYWWAALAERVPVVANDTPIGIPLRTSQRLTLAHFIRRTHAYIKTEIGDVASDQQYDFVPLGATTVHPPSDSSTSGKVEPMALRQSLGLPQASRLAVAINPLIPVTGLKDAIWSCDLIKCIRDDFHLLILGEGPQRWRLQRFVAQTETTDRVHFVRGISADRLLQQADVLWQTPRQRTDPSIVLMSMAYGVPVIATNFDTVRPFVQHGETGFLIERGDRSKLARHTQTILADDSLRQQMASQSRQAITDKFPAETMVDRYGRIYRSCLK